MPRDLLSRYLTLKSLSLRERSWTHKPPCGTFSVRCESSMKWALILMSGIRTSLPVHSRLGFRAHRFLPRSSRMCWQIGDWAIVRGCATRESSVQRNHPQILLDESTISGVHSQSRRSIRPPHSRQTMNSSLNVSYGPQSSPCVSTEVRIRKSPADELQSGHAMSLFSSINNVVRQNDGPFNLFSLRTTAALLVTSMRRRSGRSFEIELSLSSTLFRTSCRWKTSKISCSRSA